MLKEVVDDLTDAVEGHKMDPMGPFGHARRLSTPDVVKTELSGFENPRIHSCDGAQFASEADFAGKGTQQDLAGATAAVTRQQSREDPAWRGWLLALLAVTGFSWWWLGRPARRAGNPMPGSLPSRSPLL